MALTPLPAAPDPNSPSTFAALADAFTVALQNMVTQINAQGSVPAGITPSFQATNSVGQTVTTAVQTKLTLDTETWDNANEYDAVTNYRYAPQAGGKYRMSAKASFTAGTAVTRATLIIKRNNGAIVAEMDMPFSGTSGTISCTGTTLVVAPSSAYFEAYITLTGTGTLTVIANSGSGGTSFESEYIGV